MSLDNPAIHDDYTAEVRLDALRRFEQKRENIPATKRFSLLLQALEYLPAPISDERLQTRADISKDEYRPPELASVKLKDQYADLTTATQDYRDLLCSGESSSWSFHTYGEVDRIWSYMKDKINNLDDKDNDALSSTLEKLVVNITSNLQESYHQSLSTLHKYLPDNYTPTSDLALESHLQVAGSGASAIKLARRLLSPKAAIGTTAENGSNIFTETSDKTPIRHPDGSPLSQDEMVTEYRKLIDKGDRFLSVTLIPKTGILLDKVVDQVIDMVRHHNENNPLDQITMIVDAVQAVGRIDPKEYLKYLDSDIVSGIVHTGSKAPHGIPHAGFLWLTNKGRRQYISNLADITEDSNKFGEVMRQYEWVNPILDESNNFAGDAGFSPLAALRAENNLEAISTMIKAQEDPIYKASENIIRLEYIKLFQSLGFRVLPDTEYVKTPSIIAITRDDISKSRATRLFTSLSKDSGISMGGYLQENIPILRWGLDWRLVSGYARGEITRDQIISFISGYMRPAFQNSLAQS